MTTKKKLTPEQKLAAIKKIVDEANATDPDQGVDPTYLLQDLENILKS